MKMHLVNWRCLTSRALQDEQGRTLNLLGDMRRLSSFCDSMAVASMPSSPYRNCTTLPLDVRTVPSYLQMSGGAQGLPILHLRRLLMSAETSTHTAME